jgi:outer membrane protein TolC
LAWSAKSYALLTPEALLESAARSNPSIDSLRARHQQYDYLSKTKGRLSDPEVFLGIMPNSLSGDIGARGVLQISQKFPWPGKRRLEREIAAETVEASAYEVELGLRELRYSSDYFWAEWWYIHQALATNQKTEDLYRQLLKTASTKYENGAGLQQDLLSAQTQLMHIQHHAIVLAEKREIIRSEINLLRHQNSDDVVDRPAKLVAQDAAEALPVLLDKLDNHPTIKSLSAQNNSAAIKTELALLKRFPDFVAQAAYFSNRDPNDKRLQLGVGIQIPLDQSRRRADISAAEDQQKSAQSDLAHARAKLESSISKVLSRIRQQRHIVHLYSQRLEALAGKNRSAALNDYTNGESGFAAIAEATRHVFDVSLTLARARADLFIAHAELTKLVGEDSKLAEDSL